MGMFRNINRKAPKTKASTAAWGPSVTDKTVSSTLFVSNTGDETLSTQYPDMATSRQSPPAADPWKIELSNDPDEAPLAPKKKGMRGFRRKVSRYATIVGHAKKKQKPTFDHEFHANALESFVKEISVQEDLRMSPPPMNGRGREIDGSEVPHSDSLHRPCSSLSAENDAAPEPSLFEGSWNGNERSFPIPKPVVQAAKLRYVRFDDDASASCVPINNADPHHRSDETSTERDSPIHRRHPTELRDPTVRTLKDGTSLSEEDEDSTFIFADDVRGRIGEVHTGLGEVPTETTEDSTFQFAGDVRDVHSTPIADVRYRQAENIHSFSSARTPEFDSQICSSSSFSWLLKGIRSSLKDCLAPTVPASPTRSYQTNHGKTIHCAPSYTTSEPSLSDNYRSQSLAHAQCMERRQRAQRYIPNDRQGASFEQSHSTEDRRDEHLKSRSPSPARDCQLVIPDCQSVVPSKRKNPHSMINCHPERTDMNCHLSIMDGLLSFRDSPQSKQTEKECAHKRPKLPGDIPHHINTPDLRLNAMNEIPRSLVSDSFSTVSSVTMTTKSYSYPEGPVDFV